MTKNMTEGNPARLILLFALPLILGNVFQQFYGMADTLIVGRTIGVDALAAVGCTGSINFFILGFVNGLATGLSIRTAQRFGAQDDEGVRRSFAACIVLCAAAAVLMTVVAVPLTRPMLELLQTPPEILDGATAYLQVIFLGIPANLLFNLLSNVMRGLGDSRTPLIFLIFVCCLNVVLDLVFILVFHMGVAGAGWATILSQLLSGLLCLLFIARKMPLLHVHREHFRLEREEYISHLQLGLPMGFQMSIIAIGSIMLQFALNGLGALSVAAYTAAQKIEQIATLPMNSFGATMATYTAQNYGAGRNDRIRQGVFQCILISGGFSLAMMLINNVFGIQLTSLFVGKGETDVLALAQTYLRVTSAGYLLLALLFIYRFTLQGFGKGLIPTVAGVMELIMRAFGSVLLTGVFGFAGACACNPLAWLGACVPLAIAYYMTMHDLNPRPRHRRRA